MGEEKEEKEDVEGEEGESGEEEEVEEDDEEAEEDSEDGDDSDDDDGFGYSYVTDMRNGNDNDNDNENGNGNGNDGPAPIITRHRTLPQFKLFVRNEERDTTQSIWVKGFVLEVYGYEIEVSRSYKHTVTVSKKKWHMTVR